MNSDGFKVTTIYTSLIFIILQMMGLRKSMKNLTKDKRPPTEDEISSALCSSWKERKWYKICMKCIIFLFT
jgi:Na+/melibiose symporter-like transporter